VWDVSLSLLILHVWLPVYPYLDTAAELLPAAVEFPVVFALRLYFGFILILAGVQEPASKEPLL
jgi:hypothetical protein